MRKRHFPQWADRLAVLHRPNASEGRGFQSVLQHNCKRLEALASISVKANRRLRVTMPLATFARFVGFYPARDEDFNFLPDSTVKRRGIFNRRLCFLLSFMPNVIFYFVPM
jgi:hypothetical protein